MNRLTNAAVWQLRSASIKTVRLFILIGLLGCLAYYWAPVAIGEDAPASPQPNDQYENVRFPYYKNDVMVSLLHARFADAMGLAAGNPKVQMRGVTIYLFAPALTDNPNERPPLKMEITSDSGEYRRVMRNGLPEEIAILKDNVKVQRYLPPDPKDPTKKQEVDATVLCEKATWNHTQQVLVGDGHVRLFQENNTLEGQDFRYFLDNHGQSADALQNQDSAENVGGWFELARDVRMRFSGKKKQGTLEEENNTGSDPFGKIDPSVVTTITCRGNSRYNIDTREVVFQDDVVVTREKMILQSDFLKVMMRDGEKPIREIIAWSTKSGNVTIRGKVQSESAGVSSRVGDFVATGEFAQYNGDTEELRLEDRREGRLPMAQYDSDQIFDQILIFEPRTDILRTSGGKGLSVMQTKMGEGANSEVAPTEISYKTGAMFNRGANFALFSGKVVLTRQDLVLKSEKLRVDLNPPAETADGTKTEYSLRMATATEDVEIIYGDKRAIAAKATLTPGALGEKLILTGPPDPQVYSFGGFFEAKVITSERILSPGSQKQTNLITADGPGSGVFSNEKKDATDGTPVSEDAMPSDAMTIRFEKVMTYDEAKNRVHFEGDVIATNADQVMKSRELEILLEDELVTQKGAAPGATHKKARQFSAIGDATLHWGDRHCEGARIIRDIPMKLIVLHGAQGRQATIWEDNGNRFSAPTIRASDDGSKIHSSGGGRLVIADEDSAEPVVVTYEGDALYASSATGGKIVFKKAVQMRKGKLTVFSDQMETELEDIPNANSGAETKPAAGGGSNAMVPRRLKRVIAQGNVRISHLTRNAFGSVAELKMNPGADVMTLYGSRQSYAEIQDSGGFRLFSPDITVRQNSGIVQASGPGEVHIDSMTQSGESHTATAAQKYVINYDKNLVYNSLARKIRLEGNVRIKQENVRGRCDILLVILSNSPEMQTSSSGSPVGSGNNEQIEILALDAYGKVRFKRFEPDNPNSVDTTSLLDREGKTVFTKSEEAHYDVPRGMILLSGKPEQPQAIQQVLKYNGSMPVRNRMRFRADEIWVGVGTGDVKMRGNQKTDYLPSSGPIDMDD